MAHPLRSFRQKYQFSLQSIADLMGVSVSSLSRIETGRQICTAEMAVLIEDATRGRVRRQDLRPDLWPSVKASLTA
jgi:DNA-binding transcriptional regulator YdaS (Cro superfamily)